MEAVEDLEMLEDSETSEDWDWTNMSILTDMSNGARIEVLEMVED